jgi:hypothetical protein
MSKSGKLGSASLAALVVSAMIGGGIFSLPQNMAQSSALLAVVLAWVVTGIGMFFLANTFRILAEAKPDATTGIYAYARLGFGKFAGFQMAWSYWLCNIFGNVGYAVLLMDAFDYFFSGKIHGRKQFSFHCVRFPCDLAHELHRSQRRSSGGIPQRSGYDRQTCPHHPFHPHSAFRVPVEDLHNRYNRT